jgi:biopolymer transport protein ExbD
MLGSPQSLLTDATPELNTTPLIDVMLVLVMMFMLTVPIATHIVHLDTAANHHARIEPPTALRLRCQSAGRGSTEWSAAPALHRQRTLPLKTRGCRRSGTHTHGSIDAGPALPI